MDDRPTPPPPAAPATLGRLRFIDMARSIAILLMLEGHFVDVALVDEARRPGWAPYAVWNYIRGLTAPVFFTVTGLVFAFLLCRHGGEPDFFRLVRVRRGLLRAVELLFWGYVIQLDLRRLPDYLAGNFGSWPFAFHVLQCIGVGLLLMIGLFGLRRWSGVGPTWLWFAGGGVVVYLGGVVLGAVPAATGFPAGAPDWLRNPFKGPYSVFPVAPWLAFTAYGAAAGALLRHYEDRVRQPAFPLIFLGAGLAMCTVGWHVDQASARLIGLLPGFEAVPPATWFHLRAGEAFLFIGLLLAWENRFGIRESWFLVIGRNTFPIYVLHVIVLYGGLFGVGLSGWIRKSMGMGGALLGALVFLAAFAALAQLMPPLTAWWRRRRAGRP